MGTTIGRTLGTTLGRTQHTARSLVEKAQSQASRNHDLVHPLGRKSHPTHQSRSWGGRGEELFLGREAPGLQLLNEATVTSNPEVTVA